MTAPDELICCCHSHKALCPQWAPTVRGKKEATCTSFARLQRLKEPHWADESTVTHVQTVGSNFSVCRFAALRVSAPPHGTPNYRDFLMDILLSPLSDSLLLLWDEALCIPQKREREPRCVLFRVPAARYMPGNMIGPFYTSFLGAFHYRLYSIT